MLLCQHAASARTEKPKSSPAADLVRGMQANRMFSRLQVANVWAFAGEFVLMQQVHMVVVTKREGVATKPGEDLSICFRCLFSAAAFAPL